MAAKLQEELYRKFSNSDKNWRLVNSYVVSRLVSRPNQMSGLGWVKNLSVLQFSALSRGIGNGVFNRAAVFLAVTSSTFDGCCF